MSELQAQLLAYLSYWPLEKILNEDRKRHTSTNRRPKLKLSPMAKVELPLSTPLIAHPNVSGALIDEMIVLFKSLDTGCFAIITFKKSWKNIIILFMTF